MVGDPDDASAGSLDAHDRVRIYPSSSSRGVVTPGSPSTSPNVDVNDITPNDSQRKLAELTGRSARSEDHCPQRHARNALQGSVV
jgi:hypothetical protein